MLKDAIDYGLDPVDAIKMVTINPSTHYNLNSGLIVPGRWADMVVVDDLEKLNVKEVYIKGELVAKDNQILFTVKPHDLESSFKLNPKLS